MKKAVFEPKPLELSYFNYLQNIKKRKFLAIALFLPKVCNVNFLWGKIIKVKFPDQFCSAWHFTGAYSGSASWSPLESQPAECLPHQGGDLRGSCCSLPPATLLLPLWHWLSALCSFVLDQISKK